MAREMKDSGVAWVGKIPISWSCQKLKYFAKINSGEMISKEEFLAELETYKKSLIYEYVTGKKEV